MGRDPRPSLPANNILRSQGLGQLDQHHRRTLEQGGPQRELLKAALSAQGVGVAAQRAFPGDEVLVHPHRRRGSERECPECQGSIAVPDHSEPASRLQDPGGGIQQEPVCGVPGLQVRRLDVRDPAQAG